MTDYPRNGRIALNVFGQVPGIAIQSHQPDPPDLVTAFSNFAHDNLFWIADDYVVADGANTLVDQGGNIVANPMFVSDGDLHLREGSPAIGQAPATYLPDLHPERDHDAVLRSNPTALGAYDFSLTPRLGCGVYEAAIYERGGQRIVGYVPWSSLDWERLLDDTSSASLSLTGVSGYGPECCDVFGVAMPWEHELHVFRDTRRCWSGPIVRMEVDSDTVELEARDLSAWWDKRRIHRNHNFSGHPYSDPVGGEFVDLSTMFEIYALDAMAPDNSPGLCVDVTPTGTLAERNVLASQHVRAGQILRELARAGIDWTLVDRLVVAGGLVLSVDPLPTLTDDHFREPPRIIIDGLKQENDAGVRGAGVGKRGDTLWASSRDGDSIGRCGLLEGDTTESGLEDIQLVRLAAQSRRDALKDAVATIEQGVLDDGIGVRIEDLIPGALAPVRLNRTCKLVSGTYRLARVSVSAVASSEGGSESVTIVLQPEGTLLSQASGETGLDAG